MQTEIRHIKKFSWAHKFRRQLFSYLWSIQKIMLPRTVGNTVRIFILKAFGAKVDPTAVIYNNVEIWEPRNLIMEEYSCLGDRVICYNVAVVSIGENSVISQGAHLCSASHDIVSSTFDLLSKPIMIRNNVWIAADSFVGMGVEIADGCVIGARAVVVKSVGSNCIVAGNPAKIIGRRNG